MLQYRAPVNAGIATRITINRNNWSFYRNASYTYQIIQCCPIIYWHGLSHECIMLPHQDISTSIYKQFYCQALMNSYKKYNYNNVMMGTMAYQITSLTSVYSAVYSGADRRKHQSSASLAFVFGIRRGPVNSPHKWPVTRKMFPFDDVIMCMRGNCLCLCEQHWHDNASFQNSVYIYILYNLCRIKLTLISPCTRYAGYWLNLMYCSLYMCLTSITLQI